MPMTKDLHYFDSNFYKSPKWYRSFFPLRIFHKKKTGEATPYYLFHPLVAERIYKMMPEIKLIILLRNPVDRAVSHFNMMQRKGFETSMSFAAALEKEEERLQPEYEKFHTCPYYKSHNHQHHSYVSRGMYSEQLKRYFRYFDRNQLLILKSEDFFSNPVEVLQKIFKFLGVKPFHPKIKNTRSSYETVELSEVTLSMLKQKFYKELQSLHQLLGENFSWDFDKSRYLKK